MKSDNSLSTQFVQLSKEKVPTIERIYSLEKGTYKINFEWQGITNEPSEVEIFWNHQLIASFKSSKNKMEKGEISLKACECCEGKNSLKFAVVGEAPVGVDNIVISN